jgi:putative heme-binding domain-containing protein
MRALLLAFAAFAAPQNDDTLGPLVDILNTTDDPSFQLDILKGIRDGLKGRTGLKMPKGWSEVAGKLAKSANGEVRDLAQAISTSFGDLKSLDAVRGVLADAKQPSEGRLKALEVLLNARDPALPPVLLALLQEKALRGPAMRALASYDDPKTPAALLALYGSLDVEEKRDAMNTLVARGSTAKALVEAVKAQQVPRKDLTAAIIRSLRDHKDPAIDSWIEKEWGMTRTTPESRAKEIAEMKAMVLAGPKGDPARGRAFYAKVCGQCHTLFDAGGKVGPELTGANRTDVDYLLGNIMDPSALVGKDYQATVIRTRAERLITGLLKEETADTVTIATENDVLVLDKKDIDARKLSEISMMPEGLLGNLSKPEVRDLIAYLQSPVQVAAAPVSLEETIFNGKDLTGWEGDKEVWSVENGEIVGKGPQKKNQFLYYTAKEVADFRLTLEVKLTPHGGNSGIQFRSEKLADGHAKGYQADLGAGWWGKLYHEHGRALLWDKPGDQHVKKEDWNGYEVLAVGKKIQTAVNGKLCVDFVDEKADPAKDMKGWIAFQVHSGGAMEVRFRGVKLEHNPEFKLKTVK